MAVEYSFHRQITSFLVTSRHYRFVSHTITAHNGTLLMMTTVCRSTVLCHVGVESMLSDTYCWGSGIAILLCFSDQSGDDIDIVKLGIDGGRESLKTCLSILLSDDMSADPSPQSFRWFSAQLQILKSLIRCWLILNWVWKTWCSWLDCAREFWYIRFVGF
jgi:hypothetical protein